MHVLCEAGVPGCLGRLLSSTFILVGLLSGIVAPPIHAQEEHPPVYAWSETETVELSRSNSAATGVSSLELTLREGESVTYYLRLSKQPVISNGSPYGWWVRVHVDGSVHIDGDLPDKGISWIPSVGWEFKDDGSENPTRWRGVTFTATEDYDPETDGIVNITHEVWDENSACPPALHGIASVTVRIIDDDVESTGVLLETNPSSVAEGSGATPVTVTATLNGSPRDQDTDVTVNVANRAADFAQVDPLTITIPQGQTSATASFSFEPVDDELVEGDETVAVTGSASGLSVTRTTLTILDNDTTDDGNGGGDGNGDGDGDANPGRDGQ